MKFEHLEKAIEDCRKGKIHFSNGLNLHCFLFEKTWFPIRAVLNHASQLAGENKEFTTNNGIGELHKLLTFVRIQTVHVQNNKLVDVSSEEAFNEINHLANLIISLT
ncbi:MAG: hypothetical protein NXI00_02890 [Cytophagales bacterium]|nr:hypothetical protein [Cytophagales bacterium]